MIVIFSTQDDFSTQKVSEWLQYKRINPVVINELNPITDLLFKLNQKKSDLTITLKNGLSFSTSEINIIWYRRGLYFFNFSFLKLKEYKHLSPFFHNLKDEYEKFTEYFFDKLKSKTIGDFSFSNPNKLMVLDAAVKHGLKIPSSRVINNRSDSFDCGHINKNISEVLHTVYDGKVMYNRTTIQDKYESDKFFPSLIQVNIEKYCELRVFYFADTFFTMATIASHNRVLKTDTREITGSTDSYQFPFSLPIQIAKQLQSLIRSLRFTTCSIDMIIDKNYEYYFLEINPIGQFSNLSQICNYNIEKFIATKLISYE